ncbi:GMC oxidoreductase [Virgisporangium aurantiacum]|uniref:Pyranose oxidase n=1 Tax=Virgisporangium aurantiacum TaxID=175570 RepID=A0A8J3ZDU0_9ACTN|nr:GMC oxidoreductase [Virgisporangium aurantiacum]GIJ62162.1 pyranose oxidase [Virgisporangium aurantiacum]
MTRNDVDVLIVGSGPIGSTFARTISDLAPTLRILMVEGGPQITDPPGRHVKTLSDPAQLDQAQIASQGANSNKYEMRTPTANTAAEGGRPPVVARPGTYLLGGEEVEFTDDGMPAAAMSTNVGGMGAHWTCACPTLGDGERPDVLPRAEFDALFADAWRLLQVTQSAFESTSFGGAIRASLAQTLGDILPEGRGVQAMPLAVSVRDGNRYWTGTDIILDSIAERGHFELRAETLLLRVLHEDGNARGARLRDRRTGEEYEVSARVVVIAADSFRTPQLLFASGVRPPALGRYLNDHPQAIGLARVRDEMIPPEVRAHRVPGQLDGLSGVNWIPYSRDEFPYHVQVMQLDASPVPLDGLDEPVPGSLVGIGIFGCKELQADDRVAFDEHDLDADGLPVPRIHYTLTAADRATLEGMVRTIDKLAAGLGGLVAGRPPVILPSGSSLHYMGTTRMGATDDGTSVCDTNSAVWGTRNLYVGGNGVIPTPTAGNPTAASVALAIRSARHIVTELASRGSDTATAEHPALSDCR